MPVSVAIPKENTVGEKRVALDPSIVNRFSKQDIKMLVQTQAGITAHFTDTDYKNNNAEIVDSLENLYQQAQIIIKIQPPTVEEVTLMAENSILISLLFPHKNLELVKALQQKKITSFAMELVPRISRAQSMDVLSSQASVAGYKAAIMGADLASVFFPMLTTAAGTIRPAKVLVIGAGVAGLQAIATAKRLGAQVEAYDIRAAAKEQVESLGAKLVDTGVNAEAQGGYARELTQEEKQQQADVLAKHIAQAHVVISTAAVPGRPAPKIITQAMVEGMPQGAVIIDLAAETGGNCELTEVGSTITHQSVLIHGPINVPSQVPIHASEMYAKNCFNFLNLFIDKAQGIQLNWDDEILADSVVTHEGEVKHAVTAELLKGE